MLPLDAAVYIGSKTAVARYQYRFPEKYLWQIYLFANCFQMCQRIDSIANNLLGTSQHFSEHLFFSVHILIAATVLHRFFYKFVQSPLFDIIKLQLNFHLLLYQHYGYTIQNHEIKIVLSNRILILILTDWIKQNLQEKKLQYL